MTTHTPDLHELRGFDDDKFAFADLSDPTQAYIRNRAKNVSHDGITCHSFERVRKERDRNCFNWCPRCADWFKPARSAISR